MIETLLLFIRKIVGVGVMGGVGLVGVGATEDAFAAVKDYFLAAATQTEMSQCHKVIFSFYLRDNRFPDPETEIWGWFAENYDKASLENLRTDGWFTPYKFITEDYEIQSAGPDKKHETGDDFGQHYPSLAER